MAQGPDGEARTVAPPLPHLLLQPPAPKRQNGRTAKTTDFVDRKEKTDNFINTGEPAAKNFFILEARDSKTQFLAIDSNSCHKPGVKENIFSCLQPVVR